MSEINKVAVLGSGVMGAAIAAHVANSGTEVLLYDIVPDGASDRNQLAKDAIAKLLKTNPSPFTHKDNAKRITPANLEDDLQKLGEVDWTIEAVIERLDIKQDVYKKVDANRKAGSVVSSNTSTLPLHTLIGGLPDSFAKDFMITHFFNPPRFMRLLELVEGDKTDQQSLAKIRDFCDVKLGKEVVVCKDTPGFIANRIGCFWLMAGLKHAMEMPLSVEKADAVMGRPLGIPKTGVFGLFDLIGIDLMPHIAQAFADTLDQDDAFNDIYSEPELVKNMIADGYTGRKGKGGFYRLNKEGGKKVKEAINLQTGDYATADRPKLESVEAARAGLYALLTHEDEGGQYARKVMLPTLAYTASLIPEMAEDIVSVDTAMRTGYNWKYGPFELIDRMAHDGKAGPAVFAALLAEDGIAVPDIVQKAGDQSFYREEGTEKQYLDKGGNYVTLPVPDDAWWLADKKRGTKPVLKNASAAVWDVGDGVLCLEFTSKMNSIDPEILKMMVEVSDFIEASDQYHGLLIGGDGDNFSVGANLGFLLFAANVAAWDELEGVIRQGQNAVMRLKYANFPVVSASAGMALGGGCETVLHSDAVQAHVESYIGLVEVGVGLIPGWGGCKEMLVRMTGAQEPEKPASGWANIGKMVNRFVPVGPMVAVKEAFETIILAKVAGSAEEAQEMGILNAKSRISMNRRRLMADAKQLCLQLAENYAPPQPAELKLPGKTAKAALDMAVQGFVASGKATPHDQTIAKELSVVISGGDTDMGKALTEQDLLDLELAHFMVLLKTAPTLARVEHMLGTGKPLRN